MRKIMATIATVAAAFTAAPVVAQDLNEIKVADSPAASYRMVPADCRRNAWLLRGRRDTRRTGRWRRLASDRIS